VDLKEPNSRAPVSDLFRMSRKSNPMLTAAVIALTVGCGILPTAFSLASGATVGALPAAVRAGIDSAASDRLTRFLIVAVVLFVAMQALNPVRETVADSLMVRFDTVLSRRIMALTAAPPGVGHLEDPATMDRLQQAQGAISGATPGGAVYALSIIWSKRLGGVTAVVVVGTFRWWLAVGLILTQMVVFRWRRQVWETGTKVIYGRSGALRRSSYLRWLALDASTAKEVRVFGLDRWLVGRYKSDFEESMAPVWRNRRDGARSTLPVAGLVALTQGVALWVLSRAAVDGGLGVGAVLVYVQAIIGTAGLGSFSEENGRATDGLVSLRVLQDLERELPPAAGSTQGTPVDDLPRRSIRFEAVRFRYPGRDDDVFTALDLELEAGRSVAVVGENGAGKTTLVKLLAGLYDPLAGRITVDGVDLRELDRPAWQRRVAAIFQDFVQYPFSAYDNVAVGALECCGDRAKVEGAARRAGATEMVERLPDGWDTRLGRQFTGGADLSGGEWQRLALARALLAVDGGATVLVLDEPTASLDVRAEAELYDRFLELTAGVTTVVISHRFSTVRRADRIVVLEQGRVVEDGSHDDLVAAGGCYARMYALQASRFAAEPA
jgi:ATP-binding cassette subfamily B protein